MKTVRIKDGDWAELSKIAALKQLTTTKPVPLHDVVSDLIGHKEKLGYCNNKNMCRLKGHKITL